MHLARLLEMFLHWRSPATVQRSIRDGEIRVLEDRVEKIRREGVGYARVSKELDDAVESMRRSPR